MEESGGELLGCWAGERWTPRWERAVLLCRREVEDLSTGVVTLSWYSSLQLRHKMKSCLARPLFLHAALHCLLASVRAILQS